MLKYEFSMREKILLSCLVVILLGLFYYEVAYVDFQKEMKACDTEPVMEEIQMEQAKTMAKKQMLAEIDKRKDQPVSRIPVYNAQAEEIAALAKVLNPKVTNLSVSWDVPVLTDGIVKRTAGLTFNCASYDELLNVVKSLRDLECRCLVRDLSMSGTENVSASVKLTFYETTKGSTDLSGLATPEENGNKN